MFKLFKYLTKRDWWEMLIILAVEFAAVFCSLTMPDYMNKITTLLQTGSTTSEILSAGLIMLACALGDAVCNVIIAYLAARISASFARNLREKVYNKVVSFSLEEINHFSTASLVTRSANDVTQAQMVIGMGLSAILRAPILAVWCVFKILGKGWQWTLATAIAVVIVICIIASNMILVIPKFKKIQALTDNLNRVTRENLSGVRVVRAYNAEKYQQNKFEVENKAITNNHLFTGRAMSYLGPGMQMIMSGTSLAVYWIGAYMIQSAGTAADKIQIFGNLVVFMAYAMQIITAFLMLSMIFILFPRAEVSAKRIMEVLEMDTKIHDGDYVADDNTKGLVEFRDVAFKYPDAEENVLEHITFTAEPGQTVAFIGSTGSGKSTLINLIPRFYDVTEGSVLVDGVDVRKYTQASLHTKIGYVSQKAILFKGTIASNVDYGEDGHDANEADIIRSMEIAQGADILAKTDKGIMADVAQGGQNFSGGQKQRISIARAICKNPEIYIFDDSFSALDYKTDKTLRAVLKNETATATKLIVAQRIGTVKDADKIIVLDEGKMVGMGTHLELLKNCEVYRQIAYSQLSEEELENA